MSNLQQTREPVGTDTNDGVDAPIASTPAEAKPHASRQLFLDVISFAARFGLAWVWLSAGYSKLGSNMDQAQTIIAYDIFTTDWSIFLGRIIGPLEIAGGALLLVGLFLRRAAWVSIVVLILFMIGISQAWVRGLVIDCGCFGKTDLSDGGMDYAKTIARDVGFILMSLWVAYRPFRRFALYP